MTQDAMNIGCCCQRWRHGRICQVAGGWDLSIKLAWTGAAYAAAAAFPKRVSKVCFKLVSALTTAGFTKKRRTELNKKPSSFFLRAKP
ncbi:hypothetical protein TNIN_162991 [Trichonephila inaurata madagascariensis]|uniref:Uncharacterized protein n=1 Tax=Trichonephila inaurata madagascariensis TaxID=2747483 RepID=A0A8X7BU51_9ARAC|nr:hypothetical protein TNIN_162981 [Trichonephila inaurata madagascariensis]GFY45001.1 hypothetical protein TNIN_162991 [Trichonephila inaurata madagascariensis]